MISVEILVRRRTFILERSGGLVKHGFRADSLIRSQVQSDEF